MDKISTKLELMLMHLKVRKLTGLALKRLKKTARSYSQCLYWLGYITLVRALVAAGPLSQTDDNSFF